MSAYKTIGPLVFVLARNLSIWLCLEPFYDYLNGHNVVKGVITGAYGINIGSQGPQPLTYSVSLNPTQYMLD